MRRNQHTTNLKRQMQGAPPHMRWASSGAHKEWQKAVSDGNMPQAQALWNDNVIHAPQVAQTRRKTYSRSGRQQVQTLSLPQQIAQVARR